jgi:alpha-tubulin suppressor-like RCC1 family protein
MYEADGDYQEAAEAYASLDDYSDALERSEACSYAYALERYEYGYYEESMRLFYALGSYQDATEYAKLSAAALSDSAGAGELVSLLVGLTNEQLDERARLKQARESLPHGIVATGYLHTVAVKEDGTVLAAGSNGSGQGSVTEWGNIAAVAAGAYHTVGLLNDGTVVACGSNKYGQCDVAGWQNITAVYAGAYNTVGIQRDGTIVSTGYAAYRTMKWHDVTDLSVGDYALCGVMENGQPLSTADALIDDTFFDLVAIDAATAECAGLKADGTVVAAELDTSGLTNILAIDCTPNGLFALDDAGRIFALFYRERDAIDISGWDGVEAVAISASATHVAAVTKDGRVIAEGLNNRGQCNTDEWVLFTPPPEATPTPETAPEP